MSLHIVGEKNLIFLHIPRTAGTSIADWLLSNKGNSHYAQWETHPKLSTVLENRIPCTSFTVVRNPWDRMISLYFYMRNISINKNSNWIKMNNITHNTIPSFEEWVCNIDDRLMPEEYWFKESTPQVDWIDREIDIIIRYENLKEDFIKIQQEFKTAIELPYLNSSGRSDYADYYNDSTKKLVGKIFEADIDEWKYSF